MTVDNMLEQALAYERLGWSVIPLLPGTKKPLIPWKNQQTTRATKAEIQARWKKHPKANVGVITGKISGIEVVDLDGPYAQDILEAQAKTTLPESIRQITGRKNGGKQVFFRYHGEGFLKTKAGVVSDGNGNAVDLKTDGGYVVLPPSLHETGRRYQWEHIDPTEMGLDDLEGMPSELLAFLIERCGKGTNGQNEPGWQDPLLSGVDQGSRHNTAMQLAGRWAALGFKQPEITMFLIAWNEKNRPPKPTLSEPTSKELHDIVSYAVENAYENSRLIAIEEEIRDEQMQDEAPVAFPSHVMEGVAGDFARLYNSYLESPVEFFYMAFLTCLGVLLSGRITLKSELKPQPRLYTLLLGESSTTRKSTALSKTVEFFKSAVRGLCVSYGIGSAEGLQANFEADDSLVLCLDEFKQFISKCRIQSSVLLPCVTTLFESNEYTNRTRKSNVELHDAHLSILAASTVETYDGCWDPQFTDIGFNNRIFIVPGTAKRRLAFPSKIPDAEKKPIKKRLGEVLKICEGVSEIPITYEAWERYNNWYMGQEASVHAKRLDTYAMRLMILLTMVKLERRVTPEIVQKAIDLCDWQKEMRRRHDPVDADSEIAKMEQKIRRVLSEGPKTDRELKQRTNANRAGLWVYQSAKNNLTSGQEIMFHKKAKKWVGV